MAKEIAEQPTVLGQCLAHYVPTGTACIACPTARLDFAGTDRLIMVACGTAYYACLTAKYWFEQLAGLPCEVDIASEFRYREPPVSTRTPRSSSASRARPPTRWPRCAMPRPRRGRVGGQRARKLHRARKRYWRCRSMPGWRSASPRPRPSPEPARRALPASLAGGPPARPPGARARGGACEAALRSLPALINQALALEDPIQTGAATGRGARRSCSSGAARCSPGAGRRAEAQGNQLYPRRGLCQRRAEARPHRADRQACR
jgi:hypothetical protein